MSDDAIDGWGRVCAWLPVAKCRQVRVEQRSPGVWLVSLVVLGYQGAPETLFACGAGMTLDDACDMAFERMVRGQ